MPANRRTELPELIIFDFDGTLVDTAPDLIRSTNLYLESQEFEALSEERIRNSIGFGLRNLIMEVWPDQSVLDDHMRRRIEGEFLAVYEREYLVSPTLFPGVREFLTQWDRQIAIVSNKRRRYIDPILQKLEIDHLPWVQIVGGDTFPQMKPHPVPFLAAIAAAGVTIEETIHIGDGIPDIEGALNVGCRCLAVEFGYTPVQALLDMGANGSLASFDDLFDLLSSC